MTTLVVLLGAVVATVGGLELTDEQYYTLPKLYHLDDFEECVAGRRGVYCLGSFDLLRHRNDELHHLLQEYSLDNYHFNRTEIHRGLCLRTSCSHIKGSSSRLRFHRCVDDLTRAQFGLEANLTKLHYCRTAKSRNQVDAWDLTFAWIVGALLLLNVVGTVYDVLRNKTEKPIKQLVAWSMIDSWQRLVADHSGKDPSSRSPQQHEALRPVNGMKTMTFILTLLGHSVMAFYITYTHNPRSWEITSHAFLTAYLQNGPLIVQSFIMISSFLFAYNLLVQAGDNPKMPLGIRMLPRRLMHRIIRISPLYLFILGLTTSWWPHASDGPLWAPLVVEESSRCRSKWWAQALFVNNFVKVDDTCLVHTWFLAVDMQLYVVTAVLTLLLSSRPRTAVRILVAILVATIVVNFAAIYHFKLLPMVKLVVPKILRTQLAGYPSFVWLYTAPWGSLPSALVGLIVAFVHYNQQTHGVRPAESKLVRILYRSTVPMGFLWIAGGYFAKYMTAPLWTSLYAAVDRLVFVSIIAMAMYGFLNKIDTVWWKLMSWRAWDILGRMSLSVYLIHWLLALLLVGTRSTVSEVSILNVGGHWLSTIFLAYWAALPLHLLVELPMMKFLNSIT